MGEQRRLIVTVRVNYAERVIKDRAAVAPHAFDLTTGAGEGARVFLF